MDRSSNTHVLIALGIVVLLGIITFALAAATLGTLNKRCDALYLKVDALHQRIADLSNKLPTTTTTKNTTAPATTPITATAPATTPITATAPATTPIATTASVTAPATTPINTPIATTAPATAPPTTTTPLPPTAAT